MFTHTRVSVALAAMMASGVATFPNLAAAANIETYSQSVSTAGLDLATPQGEAALHRRIALAARAVCGLADMRDLAASADVSRCRADAIRGARPSAQRLVAQAKQAAYAANMPKSAAANG